MPRKLLNNLQAMYHGHVVPLSAEQALPTAAPVAPPAPDIENLDFNFQNLISSVVSKHDESMEPERYKYDYTHVSSLKDVCTRKYALILDQGTVPFKKVNSSDRFIWAVGRAVENHIRSSYIEAAEFKNVYGVWKCRCGEAEHYGFHNEHTECARCFSKLNRYHEYPLFDHQAQIVGNPDFIVFLRERGLRVIEIKSIKGKAGSDNYGFDALTRPIGDHIFQALMYRYLLKANHKEVDSHVTIVYANKEYQFNPSQERKYKEFIVDATTPMAENIVETGLRYAREIAAYRTNKTIPARSLCSDINCSMAKKCPVAIQCFIRG